MPTISGGIKFFETNYALFKKGASATASTNDSAAKSILDTNQYTQWESIGSNDLTNETIEITLPSESTIDSILLRDFNFKNFSVKYFDGASFVDFSNVVGVNGVESASISETSFAYDSGFYQFDSVSTTKIQIVCSTTQIANTQKYLTNFFATKEIGTFLGYPRVNPTVDRNERVVRSLSGKAVVQKSYMTNNMSINFKTHPYQNDIDLLNILFNREEPFLVYLCGGRTGSNYFKIEQINWRLRDMYNMQIVGSMKNDFEKGVYILGVNKTIKLEEHV